MKKALSVILCLVLVLSLAACGAAKEEEKVNEAKASAVLTVEKKELKSGDTLKINVKSEGLNYETSPWVGIVPAGDYVTEYDIDDVDLWYEYITEDTQDFEVNPDEIGLESGEYLVTVADSDDNEAGGILATETISFTKDAEEAEEKDEGVEKNSAYFAEKYGLNICPFSISVNGEEKDYHFRNGGDLTTWTFTEENTDGWYYYNDRVISADNKYAIGPEIDSFSSSCTYEAQPYDGPALTPEQQAEIKDGVLYILNSYTPYRLNWGVALESETEEDEIEYSANDIEDDFNAGENVCFYSGYDINGDVEFNAELLIFNHDGDMSVYGAEMTDGLRETAVDSITLTNPENEAPSGTFSIAEPGRYDIVLTYDGFIAGYVVITIE